MPVVDVNERYITESVSDDMASVEVAFTVVYLLATVCLVAPPTEFIAAGLTIQNLFSGFLGSEDMNFIYYHIKRTAATVIFHSLLPLGYCIGIVCCTSQYDLIVPWNNNLYWGSLVAVALFLPLAASILTFQWSRNKWSFHPISKILSHHATERTSWYAVASSINVEFRRIDKFTTGTHGQRLIVTDSWLIQMTTYGLHVAHQSDVHLNLVRSTVHDLSHESSTGIQYLNIAVSSVNEHVKPFTVRLNSLEYNDLKTKLQAPIRNARNVVIQQSLSDRFLDVFRQQVDQNPIYRKPDNVEIEPCIGCMQTQANTKLQKLCSGDCVECYCRPMWCLECMGKWFASRQQQTRPETWLESRTPCPTCRAPFCVLDICKVI